YATPPLPRQDRDNRRDSGACICCLGLGRRHAEDCSGQARAPQAHRV
ncbi:uncharacterized protein METZ01_LOCUS85096, partial [marine metagenome]